MTPVSVPLLPGDINEGNFQYWVGAYGVTGVNPPPPLTRSVSITMAETAKAPGSDRTMVASMNNEMKVPDGYIAERAKVPFIYTSFYEGRACGKYLFVNAWVPEQVVPPLIKFMTDDKQVKRGFAVGRDYAFGRGMIEAAKKTIKDGGGTILGEEYQPLQQSDWTAIISKIRTANPDGII